MASPLLPFRVTLPPDQLEYLKLKAARRHLSVSALIRELVRQQQERDQRTERRAQRTSS